MSRRRKEEEEEAVQEARRRAAPSVREFKYNKKRVRLVSQGSDLKADARCILYWMSRDQRVQGANRLAEGAGKRSSRGWQKPWSLPTVGLGAGPPSARGTGGIPLAKLHLHPLNKASPRHCPVRFLPR